MIAWIGRCCSKVIACCSIQYICLNQYMYARWYVHDSHGWCYDLIDVNVY